jgi:hypothetical protein
VVRQIVGDERESGRVLENAEERAGGHLAPVGDSS